MIVYNTKQETPLDEVEMALGIFEIQNRELIKTKTHKEISNIINRKYNINSTEEQINLLYEPTISEMETDLRLQFEVLGLDY